MRIRDGSESTHTYHRYDSDAGVHTSRQVDIIAEASRETRTEAEDCKVQVQDGLRRVNYIRRKLLPKLVTLSD